jgi:hypothetical protein
VAALQANGCREEQVAERRLPRGLESPRSLLDQLFGGGIPERDSLDDGLGEPLLRTEGLPRRHDPEAYEGGWVNDDGHIRYLPPPGNYRTLCVRTCDGYFFPMSSASSPSEFDRDQMNCQSSCPGTEVQVYYHHQGQESVDMRSSFSGAPYADLPTAYLYKQMGTPTPAGCACSAQQDGRPRNFSVIAGNRPQDADPDAGGNLNGGPDAEAQRRLTVTPKVNEPSPSGADKRVRVVGPVFLPDPEAGADPQVQAPNPVP